MNANETIIFKGADVCLRGKILKNAFVAVENGLIAKVSAAPLEGGQTVDLTGKILSAGFIDIHIHGASGQDTNEATADGFRTIARTLASRGVTSFLPTTLACPPQTLRRALETVRIARGFADGANIVGAHLESNFISPAFKGAQPEDNIFTPLSAQGEETKKIIAEFRDTVKIITVAPEVAGVPELISWLKKLGIISSLGHSAANYDEAVSGIRAGATHATHLFNAMPPLHHRNPGLVGAVLESKKVFTEIICDGLHVHPAVLATVFKTKSLHAVPVTDALRGCAPGHDSFDFGGRKVTVKDGYARLENGTIAGSVAGMDGMLKLLKGKLGFSTAAALRQISAVPAKALKLKDRGEIRAGLRADFAVLDAGLNVCRTIVCGRTVWERKD